MTERRRHRKATRKSEPATKTPAPSRENDSAPPTPRAPTDDGEALHIIIMDPYDQEGRYSEGESATLPLEKSRFARIFASYDGARVTAPMRLRAKGKEAPTEFGKIVDIDERIKIYTNQAGGTLPDQAELLALGDRLFKTLFPDPVRRLYNEARVRQKNGKLDLVFTSMVPWIADKPWEFAYDSERKSFLATEEVNFIRNVLTSVPTDAVEPHEGCLKILVAAAQPVGYGPLSIEQESAVIRRGFASLVTQGLVKVDVLARATPEELHSLLSTGDYSVVHFIGHGTFDEATEEGALIFVDEDGTPRKLGGAKLRQILCGRNLSLVFLNACLSGTGGRANFNKGVAQSLVERGLPALVANQYSVLDSSATSFARHFYWSLAHGLSLGQAATEARIAVNYSLHGEVIDWAVPVVYARNPNMVLCAPSKGLPTDRTRASTSIMARKARAIHKCRIAVWDMDDAFPELGSTLERMTEAQNVFGFEQRNASIPLDVWDLDNKARDGTPYLWAERLANRLKSQPSKLGVHVLLCITRHWLTDNETLNLYGWWPDRDGPAVCISSCAGFAALPPAGRVTDRVLANLAVTGLAGHFAGGDSHIRGPKTCPRYYNGERDFACLSGSQMFCATCRKSLKTLGAKLPALDSLLKLFSND